MLAPFLKYELQFEKFFWFSSLKNKRTFRILVKLKKNVFIIIIIILNNNFLHKFKFLKFKSYDKKVYVNI